MAWKLPWKEENAGGDEQSHGVVGISSSGTGGPSDCKTNGKYSHLSACTKHNPPVARRARTGDLESQPLETEQRP